METQKLKKEILFCHLCFRVRQ